MPVDVKHDVELLNFISKQDRKRNFQNIDLILKLEREYPGLFAKIVQNFQMAKQYKQSLNENGKPVSIPWEECLVKFYLNNKYVGITEENANMAKVFLSKGITQQVFDEAENLRKIATSTEIPEHILGEPVKEKTILESIEEIQRKTDEKILEREHLIQEQFDKQFTYEWLNKRDPHNYILGLYCSCCANISSIHYGSKIAKATVTSQNVQNIVVRDAKGEIIAKGTLYVDRNRGYGVINDFELNEKYRHHEIRTGIYKANSKSKEEEEREMIFRAFQRGINAFVEKYNSQNPDKPLTQINVGMGYNRLKKQVERFKEANLNVRVPKEYGFSDAKARQFILYKAEPAKRKKEEVER